MSRSNPSQGTPNPANRFFRWNGEKGCVVWRDKEKKQEVDLPPGFKFLYLDETSAVRGWHDPSDSGIFSNEVRDLRSDVLLVRCKAGVLANGLYAQIKDKAKGAGGRFVSRCYIGYKGDGGDLEIGCLDLKGGALGEWMKFRKDHRKDLVEKAVKITGYKEGKKGKVVFRVPVFAVMDATPESNQQAVDLDKELQEWLTDYFKLRKTDAAAAHAQPDAAAQPDAPDNASQPDAPSDEAPVDDQEPPPEDDTDVPF